MQVIKTYKYKLKPSKAQEKTLQEWIHTCRAVYNLALDTKIYAYKSNKKNLSCYDLQKQVTELRSCGDYEWIKAVPSQSLQDVIERMDGAYKKFFTGGGFPRFAQKDRYRSITFKSVKVDGYKAILPKLGVMKFFGTRLPEGKLRQAIITKEINGYSISITTKKEVDIKPASFHSESQTIGIDVGVNFFYVTSDGEFVDNPRFLKIQQKQINMEFFKKIKKLFTNQWETVDFVKGNYTVDNTKTDFYKRNGFMEYDGMSKETVFWCTYKIQKHKETGEYRIKHDGYEDEELFRKAYKIKKKLQLEDNKEAVATLFEQNRITAIKKNYLPK